MKERRIVKRRVVRFLHYPLRHSSLTLTLILGLKKRDMSGNANLSDNSNGNLTANYRFTDSGGKRKYQTHANVCACIKDNVVARENLGKALAEENLTIRDLLSPLPHEKRNAAFSSWVANWIALNVQNVNHLDGMSEPRIRRQMLVEVGKRLDPNLDAATMLKVLKERKEDNGLNSLWAQVIIEWEAVKVANQGYAAIQLNEKQAKGYCDILLKKSKN